VPATGQYVIPAGGFLLVWADGRENATNLADLHVNFNLRASGEALGLFAPDGTQIDAITFGNQTANVSEGRFPDGSAARYFMTTPTPRAPNVVAGPSIGMITRIGPAQVQLSIATVPGLSYQLQFKDDLGAGTWSPAGPSQLAASSSLVFSEMISPGRQRFYRIVVLP
jgi:hypothetical protein